MAKHSDSHDSGSFFNQFEQIELIDISLPLESDDRIQSEACVFATQESLDDSRQDFYFKKQQHEISQLNEQIKDIESARSMREGYANKTFWLVVACLIFWAVLIVIQVAWNIYHQQAPVSDKVFITITAGITANIFAAFLGVIKGIFRLNAEELAQKKQAADETQSNRPTS